MSENIEVRSGISGWLILPAIGLVLTPLLSAIYIIRQIIFLLSPLYERLVYLCFGTWMVIGFEIFGRLALLVFVCVVANSFFKKKTTTPKYAILYILMLLLFSAISSACWSTIFLATRGGTLGDKRLIGSFLDFQIVNVVVAGIAGAIWIPYFINSRRVKTTFVKVGKEMMKPLNHVILTIALLVTVGTLGLWLGLIPKRSRAQGLVYDPEINEWVMTYIDESALPDDWREPIPKIDMYVPAEIVQDQLYYTDIRNVDGEHRLEREKFDIGVKEERFEGKKEVYCLPFNPKKVYEQPKLGNEWRAAWIKDEKGSYIKRYIKIGHLGSSLEEALENLFYLYSNSSQMIRGSVPRSIIERWLIKRRQNLPPNSPRSILPSADTEKVQIDVNVKYLDRLKRYDDDIPFVSDIGIFRASTYYIRNSKINALLQEWWEKNKEKFVKEK